MENARKQPKTTRKTREGNKKGVKLTLEERVEALKKEAEEKGLLNNLLYEELLDDFAYQTQLMKRLRAEIDEEGLTTEKTYVKGAPNLSPNKLIATYNATSNARVNTVSAIAKVIKNFNEAEGKDVDPIVDILDGGGLND